MILEVARYVFLSLLLSLLTRSAWIDPDDIIIDCGSWRLPYEFVLRRRGRNAIGKYGAGIARRWLGSLGVGIDRHHTFDNQGKRPIRPDFFDPSTRIAYEIKTGQQGLSNRNLRQMLGYEHVLRSRQATMVVYLNVAFEGRVGLSRPYRNELLKRRFRLLILRGPESTRSFQK